MQTFFIIDLCVRKISTYRSNQYTVFVNVIVGWYPVFIIIICFHFFTALKSRFGELLHFSRVFRGLWLSGQVPGQNLEPGHDFFFLRAFLFIIH
jgi:hypothetical protein